MTVDDEEIRALLLTRADRADAQGLRISVVDSARSTPQLLPVLRRSSPALRAWPVRVAFGIAVLAMITGTVALVAGLRSPDRGGTGGALVGASPTLMSSPVPSAPPRDVRLVTAPPYVAGSCPVTPITDLVGGEAPEVISGEIRWGWGPLPWQAGVGQKVVFDQTSPSQPYLDARVIIAERLPIGSPGTRVSVRYPRGSGPGFVFGVGLPEPGCWLLTAVGPTVRSSVVIEARPAPNPLPAMQNVPTERASLGLLAPCPTSPLVSGAPVRTWSAGDDQWQDPDPTAWVAGMKRRLVVSGVVGPSAPDELVVAARVGIVGPADSQASAFVAEPPVFTAPAPGSGSKAVELVLPMASCWAITYLDRARTSTIVVEVGR